jgi:hypothetical protein
LTKKRSPSTALVRANRYLPAASIVTTTARGDLPQ